jgi:hypothetical protein
MVLFPSGCEKKVTIRARAILPANSPKIFAQLVQFRPRHREALATIARPALGTPWVFGQKR